MPPDLPNGVVTLLFTDVEGSTKLLREIGDAYTEAVHEHRRVLRSAFAAHHGVEVDTQGDAFFVAFARASDAVGAVADAQRALAGGPIRVEWGSTRGSPGLPRRATSASTSTRVRASPPPQAAVRRADPALPHGARERT